VTVKARGPLVYSYDDVSWFIWYGGAVYSTLEVGLNFIPHQIWKKILVNDLQSSTFIFPIGFSLNSLNLRYFLLMEIKVYNSIPVTCARWQIIFCFHNFWGCIKRFCLLKIVSTYMFVFSCLRAIFQLPVSGVIYISFFNLITVTTLSGG
jgi:hypothetical protein